MAELRCYANWGALDALPADADWLVAVRDAGYDGVQLVEPLEVELVGRARALGLGVCGSGRVNTSADAMRLAIEAKEHGLECVTLHVGWGIESDAEAHALIDGVLEASARSGVPLYVETHRATIFQDMWRTVEFVKRSPELRFNGDFSHWYTGSEMVYGSFETKLEFIRPVLERVRFLHGRIGNPGSMQVDVGDGKAGVLPFVDHFRMLWTEVFAAYLRADDQPFFCFAPELLSSTHYYARVLGGKEETDRWAQSLVLRRVAQECFAAAEGRVNEG
ncbi:MAG: hypothetical protein V4555_08670 [Acidobacteriota bacterium]